MLYIYRLLRYWDTGKADGFVVCFDVSNRTSFGHVRNWIQDVQQHKRGEVDVALCGCKCDVEARYRNVSFQEAKSLADDFSVPYYEASAKNNVNVVQIFEHLAEKVVRRKLAQGAGSDNADSNFVSALL